MPTGRTSNLANKKICQPFTNDIELVLIAGENISIGLLWPTWSITKPQLQAWHYLNSLPAILECSNREAWPAFWKPRPKATFEWPERSTVGLQILLVNLPQALKMILSWTWMVPLQELIGLIHGLKSVDWQLVGRPLHHTLSWMWRRPP